MRVQKALCYGHNHYWAQAERRCLPTGRPAAARGRHPATGAGQGGAALLSSWRGLGRPGAATLPQARAERPEQRCSATGAPVLGAGPGRGVLLPPSLLPSCVLLSGYAAPARRPQPGAGQGGACWILNTAWLESCSSVG